MLELIKGFVNRVVTDNRQVIKSNAEILVLRHPSGERSVVNSYPAGELVCVSVLPDSCPRTHPLQRARLCADQAATFSGWKKRKSRVAFLHSVSTLFAHHTSKKIS